MLCILRWTLCYFLKNYYFHCFVLFDIYLTADYILFSPSQKDNEDEELCSVFVPTNHLYIGDIFLVNSKDIIRPNLSIREGIGRFSFRLFIVKYSVYIGHIILIQQCVYVETLLVCDILFLFNNVNGEILLVYDVLFTSLKANENFVIWHFLHVEILVSLVFL